ncbi:acyl-CoA dehydrogenase [Pseudonocardia sulfidoxydans NBRC 16205]|uniref:Acyl-CoA dehydrogenase n=1 Tax=Pseudonocardia sulfidoxydans NBRC 16205 TaxID=1223511 RepID=A0A511DG46_9PSEU|nr:acyl-CoA dehydrogenase [Pseudonocardia sulfidoxydans]GEL22714.1 acyl-CoA dehydrogenase [Pseudonocardia sulfidoxydans NBRC 16205]
MSTTGFDADLVALVDDFFGSESDAAAVEAAERTGFPAATWAGADEIGLPRVGLPESLGGAGGSLLDAVAVLVGSGRHAVPLPMLESWLAGWVLSVAGRSLDGTVRSFTAGTARDSLEIVDGRAHGTLHRLGWGRSASQVVALLPSGVVVLEVDGAQVRERTDLAGMPCDDLTFSGGDVALVDVPRQSVLARAALGRAAQLAGATEAAFELTHGYVGQREQFGRPIGRFQAVAQHVVLLAQAATTSMHVVERAALALSVHDAAFEAAAAKLVASENATIAIAAAHQAHGAIGMTQEYRLQQFTRRLMAWRAELGSGAALAAVLGRTAAHADSLAHLITDPAPALLDIDGAPAA